jgi:hypothetical protein
METTIVCLIFFACGLYGSVATFSVKEYFKYNKNKESKDIDMIALD